MNFDNTPNMAGSRNRNKGNGRLRLKRSDTHVGTIEKQYGADFKARSDMHLGTLLRRENKTSLNDLINDE